MNGQCKVRRGGGVLVGLLILTLVGCGGGSTGAPDGGAGDVGSTEGGSGSDAGPDAGEAPPPTLAVACNDTASDVYVTPGDLPEWSASERGRIVRCSVGDTATAAQVETMLATVADLAVTSGYAMYRVAYRTERDPGEPGMGSALLYLPDTPAPGPVPIVVVAHGTAGLADSCALSKWDWLPSSRELALPWVAAGLPVIAPDYAGLGTDGVHGYSNTHDTGHSVLDAARAVIDAVTPGAVDGRVVVAGHSQGGGAALAGQALAGTYGAGDLEVVAVVAFAGAYSRTNAAQGLRYSFYPITGGAGIIRVAIAMGVYADFANLFGEGRARDGFHPDVRAFVGDALESECILQLMATLATAAPGYTPPLTLGELVDPTFTDEVLDCLDGAGCTSDATAYVDRATTNVVPLDPMGAPVLLVGGDADVQVPVQSQACLLRDVRGDGLEPQACLLAGEDHMSIVPATAAFAVTWASAVVRGESLPACPPGPAYPACAL